MGARRGGMGGRAREAEHGRPETESPRRVSLGEGVGRWRTTGWSVILAQVDAHGITAQVADDLQLCVSSAKLLGVV
jgi:hypothetical protein